MTEVDFNNNKIISTLVENHFNLTEESVTEFKSKLFNADNERFIDPKLKELLDDDLRMSIDLDEENYSKLDNGWILFQEYFSELFMYDDLKVTYDNFNRNKITINKNETKLFKAIKKLYKENNKYSYSFLQSNYPDIYNKDDFDLIFDKTFKEITEKIGVYKMPNKKLRVVISLNFSDWFLSATTETWTSCLDLETKDEGCFWTGFPGLINDPNRLLIYITDGSKKEYQGIKAEKIIARTWGIITEMDTIFSVRSYPGGLLENNILDIIFNKILKFESNNWKSKHPIGIMYNTEDESVYIYQDESNFYYEDKKVKLKKVDNKKSGLYSICNGKINEGSLYYYVNGLKSLIESNTDMGDYISGRMLCSRCRDVIPDDNSYVGENKETLCEECFEELFLSGACEVNIEENEVLLYG